MSKIPSCLRMGAWGMVRLVDDSIVCGVVTDLGRSFCTLTDGPVSVMVYCRKVVDCHVS